jgi:uncharacterized membrane protein (UPF0127 family)
MGSLFNFCKNLSLVILASSPAFAAMSDPKPMTFAKDKIILGGKIIEVEIAANELEREHGLMYREELPDSVGMLFIFNGEQVLNFWMKNTFIDLSIGYFNQSRTLVDIQEMQKMNSVMSENLPTYPSAKPAKYALEMNKGWFKKNKIKLGSRFEFYKSSAKQHKPIGSKSRSKSAPLPSTK